MDLDYRSHCSENDVLNTWEINFHKFEKVPINTFQTRCILPCNPSKSASPKEKIQSHIKHDMRWSGIRQR
jgi:hypothetical protein